MEPDRIVKSSIPATFGEDEQNCQILSNLVSNQVVDINQIHGDQRARIQLLPVVTMWINSDTKLTDQEIRSMARLHPKEFEYAKKTSVAEIFQAAEKHRDDRHYRDLIEIVLSPRGRVWVERCVAMCKGIEL